MRGKHDLGRLRLLALGNDEVRIRIVEVVFKRIKEILLNQSVSWPRFHSSLATCDRIVVALVTTVRSTN